MENIFPGPIADLPEADIPIDGIRAYLSQAADHQLIFMQFEKDADLPEHSHAAQVGFVLRGKIELTIDGIKNEFRKGDIYFIPENIKHSGKIYAGYADITFFNESGRYKLKL
ncbi:cupin domain-containing protein [Thermodesulfobacteriota bacterium]